jgi:hypothetical protein
MKPTTAIKKALAQVGPLYQVGSTNWQFQAWDPSVKALRHSIPAYYWQAYENRRTCLIENALRLLFPIGKQWLTLVQPEYREGRWQDWVWKIYRENT